jgi:hypothetical protein
MGGLRTVIRMRRHLATAAIACAVLVMGAPAMAQDEPSAGDSGPAVGYFEQTDGACNFPNFSDDTYIATLGEDDRGRFIEFVQPSTGDAGAFRLDESGNITFETDGDEVYDNIKADSAGVLTAKYIYTSSGCAQIWVATVTLPPGFLTFLANDPARATEETAPPTTATTAAPTEETAPPTTATTAAPTEETAPPTAPEVVAFDTDTGGDSGLSLFVWLFIAAFVGLFGWGLFWYFLRGPKRLYRFDRGDPGEFIDEEDDVEIVIGGAELPSFGAIEEAEEVFLPPRASTIDVGVPPPHRLCDTAHGAWRESVEQLAILEAEADARVGSDDPLLEMHNQMIEQARDSMNAYRRIYEECLEANSDVEPPAPPTSQPDGDTPESPAQGDADEGKGEGDDPGEETDPGLPGIIIPPPAAPGAITDDTDPSRCDPEGTSEVRPESGLPTAQFTVLTGPVLLPATGPIASWNRAFGGRTGGLSGADLLDLSDEAVETALSDAEQIDTMLTTRFAVKALIPTATYKVSCGRVWVCERGSWTKTSETSRLPDELTGEDVETINGHNAKSMAEQVRENVSKAKARAEILMSDQERMASFGCD